jgi:hypothetical protein
MRIARIMLACALYGPAHAHAEAAAHIVVQHSTLAGFRHYDGRSIWNDMNVGDRLDLFHEADNPHDPHAVRVEWQGRTLGYVPQHENSHLARQIRHGMRLEARVTRLQKSRNGRNRVSYQVLVPLH